MVVQSNVDLLDECFHLVFLPQRPHLSDFFGQVILLCPHPSIFGDCHIYDLAAALPFVDNYLSHVSVPQFHDRYASWNPIYWVCSAHFCLHSHSNCFQQIRILLAILMIAPATFSYHASSCILSVLIWGTHLQCGWLSHYSGHTFYIWHQPEICRRCFYAVCSYGLILRTND